MSNKTPIRVDGTFSPSGTQDVNIVSSITLAIMAASLPLPAGASTEATLLAAKADLDKFTFASTRLLTDGSQVTQPISGSVSISNFPVSQAVTGPLTDAQLRATPVPVSGSFSTSGTQDVNIVSTISLPVTGTFFQATQPVSGTVTANQGTSPWVISGSVSASQSGAWTTGRTWVLASSTDSIASVQSGTWNLNNISGTISLPTGAATETTLSALNGKVTAVNTGAVTISTALPAGSNVIGHVITDSGSTVSVSNLPATQPISGTVTANAGTNLNTSALALDATLTNASQKTKLVDTGGTNIAVIDATGDLQVDVNNFPATQVVSGSVNAIPVDGNKATYSACVAGFASAALATDIWTITGSATKVIKITRIELTGTTTAGGGIGLNCQLIRRSSANTGGTAISDTAISHDTNNAAATASVVHYTANPSALGTTVGTVRSERDVFGTTAGEPFDLLWDFGSRPSQAPTLRGTSQLLALNFNGVTIVGSAIDISVEWTEE